MGYENATLTANWVSLTPEVVDTANFIVKDHVLSEIKGGSTVEEFDLGISDVYEVKIYNKNNVLKTSGKLGTGDKVRIYLDNNMLDEYIISVKGDVTGDGKINIADVSKLYQFMKGRITMDECYQYAGNIAGNDNVIRINDVSKLYQYIKGRITL